MTASTQLHANDGNSQQFDSVDLSGQWIFHVSVEQVGIDEKAASDPKAQVGDSATVVDFAGEYFFNKNFSANMGLGFLSYDDKNKFTVPTENVSTGDRENSSSDASAMPLFVDFGYKHFFNTKNATYLAARAGFNTLILSERSVANCTNCPSQDIDISGGVYGALGAGVKFGESWGMGLLYKNYFSGDLTYSIGLQVTFAY